MKRKEHLYVIVVGCVAGCVGGGLVILASFVFSSQSWRDNLHSPASCKCKR